MSDEYDLRKRVETLHEKLRMAIATCDRWPPLIKGISITGMAERGPVRFDEWTLEECREAWLWTHDGSLPAPACLIDEIVMRGDE